MLKGRLLALTFEENARPDRYGLGRAEFRTPRSEFRIDMPSPAGYAKGFDMLELFCACGELSKSEALGPIT